MVMRESARRGGARGGVAGRRGPLARPPHGLDLHLRVRIGEAVRGQGPEEKIRLARVCPTLR